MKNSGESTLVAYTDLTEWVNDADLLPKASQSPIFQNPERVMIYCQKQVNRKSFKIQNE